MIAVSSFDPAVPIGEGRTIIEASAGTGKTFTIAAAVTRLVAEEGLALEKILVVTFTRAATAELKGRVRKRIRTTLRALEADDHGDTDEHLQALLGASPDERSIFAGRLDEALTRFDRAQIFTIDGFAQRLLTRLGFRSRLPVDLEPGEIDDLLLRQAASDLVVGRFATTDPTGALKPGTVAAIGQAVVGTPDARILPDRAAPGVAGVRAQMAHQMQDVLTGRLRAGRMITFDDGLVEARDALTDPHIGTGARALLQRSYAVALIDESQDTNPIQWQIIRSVFDDMRLVVIGDPKQSIYAFRGADVESYLAAAHNADARRTLDTNWRSDGPLITALDAIFEGATFGDERIAYRRVQPAKHHKTPRIKGAGAPLQIRRFSQHFPIRHYKNQPFFYVDEAREAVAADVAAEIVKLLTSDVTISDDSAWRLVGPGDLAVLCRTRRQIDMIRTELNSRGVPSVAARSGGVLASPAAEEWRRFLLAVERPDNLPYLRMAATTLLVGQTLTEVVALQDDDMFDLQNHFRRWHDLLHNHGVPALLTDVDRRTDLEARVLAAADGERTMTDLAHIGEELHAAWRRGRIASLVVWLEAAMAEADRKAEANVEEAEARQRRLETDAAAVQILTIHAAKGLEFPIVMAPYLWDVPSIKPSIPVFHDSGATRPGEPRPRLIDVGGPSSPEFADHQAMAMEEDAAEEARLLYVALTRAKHHLAVWWIENTKNSADSKLHELLSRGDGPGVEWLADAAGGTINDTVLKRPRPAVVYRAEGSEAGLLDRAHLDRGLDYAWRRVSFSSLSPDHPLDAAGDTAERPDRVDESTPDEEPPTETSGDLAMGDLPRGARFGSLVHEVLEGVPFDAPDLTSALDSELASVTRHSSWDFDRDAFVAGMVAAITTPLGPDNATPSLRDLDPARTLKEMVFELPVRSGGGVTSLPAIAEVMLDHLGGDDPYRGYAEGLRATEPRWFRGFMTGAIDFTAAMPGPGGERYVVMDFKSNALPALGSAPVATDYGPASLAVAMHDGNYVLQALLYQVALHRYLGWRLDGYNPHEHLGGSTYLFMRGMTGPDGPVADGERCGVARWMPPPQMIVAVSDLLAGNSP